MPAAAVLDRLVQIAASLPDAHAVPTLSVVATYAWWSGDGTFARLALDRALSIDPGYSLAVLLARMVDLGVQLTPMGPTADEPPMSREG